MFSGFYLGLGRGEEGVNFCFLSVPNVFLRTFLIALHFYPMVFGHASTAMYIAYFYFGGGKKLRAHPPYK